MSDSENNFTDDDRKRISKDAEDLLKKIQNADGNMFTCGIGKGTEKEKEQLENDPEAFVNSERKTRDILIGQMQEFAIKKIITEALLYFKASENNSSKYWISLGDWMKVDDTSSFFTISVQPKHDTFFRSTVGPDRDIELFALIITVELSVESNVANIKISSYFNPEVFKNVKLEYVGDFNTGTYQHSHKEFECTSTKSLDLIKSEVKIGLHNAVVYYFR